MTASTQTRAVPSEPARRRTRAGHVGVGGGVELLPESGSRNPSGLGWREAEAPQRPRPQVPCRTTEHQPSLRVPHAPEKGRRGTGVDRPTGDRGGRADGDLSDGARFSTPRCCRTDNLGSGRTMPRSSALSNELGTHERQGGLECRDLREKPTGKDHMPCESSAVTFLATRLSLHPKLLIKTLSRVKHTCAWPGLPPIRARAANGHGVLAAPAPRGGHCWFLPSGPGLL